VSRSALIVISALSLPKASLEREQKSAMAVNGVNGSHASTSKLSSDSAGFSADKYVGESTFRLVRLPCVAKYICCPNRSS
jgi:hypothetical protein